MQGLQATLPHTCHTLSSRGALSSSPLFRHKVLQSCSSNVRTCRSTVQLVENRVKIRFARAGRKKVPFYRIVAIDEKKRRDGLPLERLGWYNPLNKETNLNAPAIKKWLEVGAEPTESVRSLLKKAMVIE